MFKRSSLLISSLIFIGNLAPQSQAKADPYALNSYDKFVIIYEENHSFDNLYGMWGAVGPFSVEGLSNALTIQNSSRRIQVRQNNSTPYQCLLQLDVNLTSPSPLTPACSDNTGTPFTSQFVNAPFQIDPYIPASFWTCPIPGYYAAKGILNTNPPNANATPGGCTMDLVHRYYNEQYQINGGMLNRYVTGSDAAGLSMGYYDTTALPFYKYLHAPNSPNYVILDKFFQSAFGGSFLNHQWLVTSKTPVFIGADQYPPGSPYYQHSVVDTNGMPTSTPLYTPTIQGVADRALTAMCDQASLPAGTVCGDYAVNTIQPFSWPYAPNTPDQRRLPTLNYDTIGDSLSRKGVDWAWYSGGWSNANGYIDQPGWTNGSGPSCSDPNASNSTQFPFCPDKAFQYHHQPLNYFTQYARPSSPLDPKNYGPSARMAHLKDEAEFIQLAQKGGLKTVSFVKAIGEQNEHPGYASVPYGSSHLTYLVDTILKGPDGNKTLIIITYDEFGGAWDHVPPPSNNNNVAPHDKWGPGTRIPAIVVAQNIRASWVDHTYYDTTSILKTLELRFGLPPLDGGTRREYSVNALQNAVGPSKRW